MPDQPVIDFGNGSPTASIAWLNNFYTQADIGLAFVSPEGLLLEANDAFFRMLHRPRTAFLQEHFLAVLHLDDPAREIAIFQELLRGTTTSVQFEKCITLPDNCIIWGQFQATILRGTSHQVQGVALILTNITDRRRLEEAAEKAMLTAETTRREIEQIMILMRITEYQFWRLMETSIIGVVVFSETRIVNSNDAFVRMSGYQRDEVTQRKLRWEDLTPAGYREIDRQAMETLLRQGECQPYLKELLRKDGSRLPILVGSALLSPQPRLMVAFVVDHTPLRRLEQEAHARAQELEAIFATISDGIIVYNADATIRQMNPAAHAMTIADHAPDGYHQSPYAERTKAYRITDEQGKSLAAEALPTMRVLRGEILAGTTAVDLHVWDFGGVGRYLSVSGAPLRREDGSISGAVLVLRDVTERRLAEEERFKMLNIVAHELRTPLTTIKLGTQLSLRRLRKRGAEEVELIEGLFRDILRIEHLVNDLLASTRADIGTMQLNVVESELREICQRSVDEQQIMARRTVQIEMPAVPIFVRIDSNRILQVISNLIANALKYSAPESAVLLRVTQRAGVVRVAAIDHGQGIPKSALPHIFEHSYRVPGVRVMHGSSEGLGLGLYVCQTLLKAHGSVLQVRSVVGKGTTFWFELPLCTP